MTTNIKRPYLVHASGAPLPRVVIATHPAQAVRYAAAQTFTVETATALQVAFLMSKGVVAEHAAEAPPQEELDIDPSVKASSVPEGEL